MFAGAKIGMNINTAVASGASNAVSNPGNGDGHRETGVFREKAFIVGRVNTGRLRKNRSGGENGVAGVRLIMEDGTYVITDMNGMFHFEGVEPGPTCGSGRPVNATEKY